MTLALSLHPIALANWEVRQEVTFFHHRKIALDFLLWDQVHTKWTKNLNKADWDVFRD